MAVILWAGDQGHLALSAPCHGTPIGKQKLPRAPCVPLMQKMTFFS